MNSRKRFVYLCTNAILLESKLHLFRPSVRLTFSVHLDGFEDRHDELVCREGVFQKAVQGIRAAKQAGFRVTSNTTVFEGESSQEVRRFLDYAVELGIDGLTISPGYPYEKAPEQERFLKREKTISLFRSILKNNGLPFNHSPQYLEFLTGVIGFVADTSPACLSVGPQNHLFITPLTLLFSKSSST